MKTSLDGGNPDDRRLFERARPAPLPDRKILCPVCKVTTLWVAAATTEEQLKGLLDVNGWTATQPRACSQRCLLRSPRAASPERDLEYERARALGRQRAGLPELPEHRGLLPTE